MKEIKQSPQVPEQDVKSTVAVETPFQEDTVKATSLRRKVLAFLAVASIIAYESWRWTTFVKSPSTYWLSIPFIVSETLVVVLGSVVTIFCALNQIERKKLRLSEAALAEKLEYPTVDILIPTYSEPVELVRATLEAAVNVRYPADKLTVCVLDDGASAEKREMVANLKSASRLGVEIRYIAREKTAGVPHHAKAGNINHALQLTQGALVAILDCDMVPCPEFLDALVPHFFNTDYVLDPKISMVQSPQTFSNVPESDPLGQTYRIFYGPGLRGWDAAGSAPCCGTNVVFQRKCLADVGNFQYGSITEDFLTSLALHNKGYRTKYVHEALCSGLAPDTYSDFFKQRFRWAAGGLQIFFKNNALFKGGLSAKQRLLYFFAGFNTLLAIPVFFMVLLPPVFLIANSVSAASSASSFTPTSQSSGISLGVFNSTEYLIVAVPLLVFNVAINLVANRGVPLRMVRRAMQEAVFIVPCYLMAISSVVFCRPLKFTVTPKDKVAQRNQEFRYILPNVFYYMLAVSAIACGISQTISASNQSSWSWSGPNNKADVFTPVISMTWVLFTCWQAWPPVGLFISQHMCSTTLANSDKVEPASNMV